MSSYIRYSPTSLGGGGGGGSGGVPIYANIASFPASATTGSLGVAADTGDLYEWNGSVWQIIGGPGVILGVGTPNNGLSDSGNLVSIALASASQNGALSSTDWTTFNNKQSSGNYITALTGDGTATGPGSAALTLASVNASIGSYGSSTSIPSFTVNGKGLITAASGNAVVAPAGTLSGTVLNSTVVSSSLTSVGTIGSGIWNGTTIAIANGGTGQTSAPNAFNALSPITTTGDIIYSSSGTTNSRLAIGSAGNVLTVSGGVPVWAAPATSGTVTSVGLSAPAFLSVGGSPVTGSGTLALSYSGTALPIANGGTAVTSVTASPTATSFAGWDANKNLSANNLIDGFTTQATAASTLTLTIASTSLQYFTGTTASQIVQLPTTSVVAGGQYTIVNSSTQTIAVQSSGTNAILTIAAGYQAVFTALVATPTTAANWSFAYSLSNSSATAGSVTSVGLSVPATSIFGTSGSPVTGSGTLGLTTTGTSGGIPYFSSTSQLASSGLLAANGLVLGGGAGTTPITLATNASTALPLISGGTGTAPSWAALTVAGGGTGLTSGTSGGILGFTASGTLASSTALTANQVVIGGGAGATPSTLAAGTAGYVLSMMGSTPAPTYLRARPIGKTNYIDANPSANTDTTGWATYANGAAANIPTNGTGGSATTLTFTRSTTTPLRSPGQFSLVKSASNGQGQGLSYAFTIDSADQAKPLSVGFDFNASSTLVVSNGTTAPLNDGTTTTNAGNSDIEVFVYDVTNSQLLYVSPQVITANGTNNWTFKGIFQTNSNSTSYRLILHVATVNAVGWTFLCDNFYVGPQILVQGSPITDVVAYTPSFSAGWGTVTNVSFFYSRLGDSMRVWGTLTSGTLAASVGSISLPFGSLDTTKLSSLNNTTSNPGQRVGFAEQTGATDFAPIVTATGTSTSVVYVGGLVSAANQLTPSSLSTPFGNNLVTSVDFTVPIAGWSSTVQMSNDTDTRVVAASVTGVPVAATALNPIIFPTVLKDTHGAYSTSTGQYTVPVSGFYSVSASSGSGQWGGATILYTYVAGSLVGYLGAGASNGYVWGSAVVYANAGQTIDVRASVTSSSGFLSSSLSINRLSGPATIAATDSVELSYYGYTSGVTGTSNATILYATKVKDTHNAYASGIYTIPVSGTYQCNASLLLATSGTPVVGTTIADLQIVQAGSATQVLEDKYYFPTTNTTIAAAGVPVAVSGMISCVAGDTIKVQASVNLATASASASNTMNFFSLVRVGV